MPYLSGVLTGIVLTVPVAFLVDQLGADSGRIVNWAVQVRKDVHEATAPDNEVGETH
jgi:hypothetical protein